MKHPAPKRALRFLRWFCREEFLEEVEGNLLELYEKHCEESPTKARRQFAWNVLRHFRPAFTRTLRMLSPATAGLLRNYLKVAWRNARKQKQYTAINLGGLTVGIACFLLMYLYVQHERSYDQFLAHSDRVYRVYQQQPGNVHLGSDLFAVTPYALAPALMEAVPEVAYATSVRKDEALLGLEDAPYLESGLMADEQFFAVLPFAFAIGNPETALQNPGSMVLTASLAQRLFGLENPLGQTVYYRQETPFTVTAVLEDVPPTSSLQFSFITTLQSNPRYVREMARDRWYNNTCHTFFALREGADPAGLEPKLAALLEQNAPSPNEASYFMHPLHDLHLTTMNAEIGSKGNAQYIRLFSLVALLILLLASVNYINLALARSLKRSREVGMRKVVGANRRQLVGQFLSESVLMASMALLLALALVHFLAPIFGVLVERPLQLNLLRNPSLLLTLGALMLGVGLLSGSYPAYLVSAFRPLQVLRGRLRTGPKGLRLDRVLMVGQFAVSVALIFGSLVIYRQFQFIQTKALGYNQEQVITLPVADAGLRDRFEAIQQTCLAHPNIVAMAASWNLPNNINSSTVINDDDEAAENSLMIYESRVTYDYLEVFGMELVSGRFFSPEHALDAEEGYVLNETAARALGWSPEEAIGQTFSHQGTETVIGVIRDFHMHTMHLAIQPLMLSLEHGGASWFSVKVRPEGLPETLAFLENTFAKHTAYPFDYQFLDDQFNQLYQAELQAGKLFGLLTLLSLIIASVGLFGMAALSAERRTQEIGIRKVLGASIQSLVGLLSADYLKLVLMGFALAVPVAGYAMHQWLMDYAYRISLSWWMFPLVGLAALLLTLLTISTHSIRSARTNPTVCLKDK